MENKNRSPEINLFVESVDDVLNSNTIYIQLDLPETELDILLYLKELFITDKFYNLMSKALDTNDLYSTKSIPNIEIKLLPITFEEFKNILIEMLAVKSLSFFGSPYNVNIGEKTGKFVVDNFIEATINNESSEPFSKNIKGIENTWKFYTMPRHYNYEEEHEVDFLQNKDGQTYRPMSRINNDNFLGKGYFSYLHRDSFLVLHSKYSVIFILTNGGD